MLRILLAEDHPAVRRGLRSLIESHAEWRVAGEAANGREAIEQAERLRPDLAILDVTMPEQSGLEASREILKRAPYTEVLLLTAHRSDELARDVSRFGARAIVSKSEADRTLIPAIEALFPGKPVHLGGAIVHSRHVGAFFRSAEERYRVLGSFVAEGLEAGEKALYMIHPRDRDMHLNGLREAGVDVDRALSEHLIALAHWDSIQLRDGRFDQNALLELFPHLLTGRFTEGVAPTRVIGMMEWSLEPCPGVENLIEFEARINDLFPRFPNVAVCAYDLTRFDVEVIVDAIRIHPAAVIGESLHENPFYVQPDRMIEELRMRRAR